MKVKSLLVFIGCCALIMFSCKHEIPEAVIPPPVGNTICFENDVLPIFQSNCGKSGCHDAVTRESGYVLDSYTNIVARGIIAGDSANSRIYQIITSTNALQVMPKIPNLTLTDAQKHIIATWIKEGATNSTDCAPACDSTAFTYSGAVAPIIQIHCRGCHGGAALDGGGIPLDTYQGVKDQVIFNTLYPAITHTGDPMPKDGNKLNDCKVTQIRKWIEAGAPNN